MTDDHSVTDYGIIPQDTKRELILPSEMASRGLELAIKIERQQGIEKYQKPILKLPGLLNRSCINFSRNGEFAAITSHGKQWDNPGLVVWNVVNRVLSVFPLAGFKKAPPSPFFVERIPTDEQMGVTKESSPISEIKISAAGARYKPMGHPESTPWNVYSVALSKCGDLALIGYGDGSIYRCKIKDGVIYGSNIIAKNPNKQQVGAIAFSPDDQLFAECTGSQVRIRDTISGNEIKQFSGWNPYYNQIAFSDDGSKLIIARGEQTTLEGVAWSAFMTLLDLNDRQPPVLFGETGITGVTAVSIFPDNQKVLSLNEEGIITVWNATNGDGISHWRHTKSNISNEESYHLGTKQCCCIC
jgi:WD40 repeat protein